MTGIARVKRRACYFRDIEILNCLCLIEQTYESRGYFCDTQAGINRWVSVLSWYSERSGWPDIK